MSTDNYSETDNSVHSLTGAYMAGALDGEQFEVYEAHLESCDTCFAEINEMELAAEELFFQEVAPVSDELLDKVLALPDSPPAPAIPKSTVTQKPSPSIAPKSARVRMFALAAAFIVIVGFGIVVNQSQTLSRAEQVAGMSDAESLDLTGEDFSVELVISESSSSVALLDQEFSTLVASQAYALWRIPVEGDPEFLGLIRINSDRKTDQAFDASIADAAAFAVSIEEAQASPQTPSEQVILVGALT